MYDLRLIHHFETIYRLLSFSKAADELNLTHSAVTKSLKTLEGQWETQLFHRTTRTVTPTQAGDRLYPLALQLLAFAETTRQETIGGERILDIVCGPAILETLLHPAIVLFRQTYPKTRIRAQTKGPMDAIEDILQRRSHLLLYHTVSLEGLPQAQRLHLSNLVSEPYYVICRPEHPVLDGDKSLEHMLFYDWAVAGFDDLFAANLPPDIRGLLGQYDFPQYRLLSQQACLDLVGATDVLSTVPASVAKPLISSGTVEGYPLPDVFGFSIEAATLVDSVLEPTTAHFIECVKTAYGAA